MASQLLELLARGPEAGARYGGLMGAGAGLGVAGGARGLEGISDYISDLVGARSKDTPFTYLSRLLAAPGRVVRHGLGLADDPGLLLSILTDPLMYLPVFGGAAGAGIGHKVGSTIPKLRAMEARASQELLQAQGLGQMARRAQDAAVDVAGARAQAMRNAAEYLPGPQATSRAVSPMAPPTTLQGMLEESLSPLATTVQYDPRISNALTDLWRLTPEGEVARLGTLPVTGPLRTIQSSAGRTEDYLSALGLSNPVAEGGVVLPGVTNIRDIPGMFGRGGRWTSNSLEEITNPLVYPRTPTPLEPWAYAAREEGPSLMQLLSGQVSPRFSGYALPPEALKSQLDTYRRFGPRADEYLNMPVSLAPEAIRAGQRALAEEGMAGYRGLQAVGTTSPVDRLLMRLYGVSQNPGPSLTRGLQGML